MASPISGSSVPPINQLINNGSSSSAAASAGSNTLLGPDAFLQLLTTELQNQDPTQPQDPTQQATQLAQFSALQYQQQLASSFTNFQSTFGVMQAASLIGKTATVTDASGSGATTTGTISSIEVQNGTPYFTMKDSGGNTISDNSGNPLMFSTSNIVGIGN